MTPFRATYGMEAPKLLCYGDTPRANFHVDELLKKRDNLLSKLRSNMEAAQKRMVSQANKHRREVDFTVGDMVYLKLRPYRKRTVAQRRNEKLSPRYFGPYEVIQKIGKVAYKLKLPSHNNINPVFQVSRSSKQFQTRTKRQIFQLSCRQISSLSQNHNQFWISALFSP